MLSDWPNAEHGDFRLPYRVTLEPSQRDVSLPLSPSRCAPCHHSCLLRARANKLQRLHAQGKGEERGIEGGDS